MAKIRAVNDYAEMDALLFRGTSDRVRDHVHERLSRSQRDWSDRSRERFKENRDKYLRITTFDDFDRGVRSVARKLKGYFKKDIIRRLSDIGDLQHAPDCMLNFLMACPELRERFYENRLDGYSGRYKDAEHGQHKEDHYYYRRVTNGVFMKGDDGRHTATIHFEKLWSEDDDLEFIEKDMILDSWELAKAFLEEMGDDPTSAHNSKLG